MTRKNVLQQLVDYLNKITGSPSSAWEKDGDTYVAQVGHYHIEHSGSGYMLLRMMNTGGGVDTPLGNQRFSASVFDTALRSFIRGIEVGKELDRTQQA